MGRSSKIRHRRRRRERWTRRQIDLLQRVSRSFQPFFEAATGAFVSTAIFGLTTLRAAELVRVGQHVALDDRGRVIGMPR